MPEPVKFRVAAAPPARVSERTACWRPAAVGANRSVRFRDELAGMLKGCGFAGTTVNCEFELVTEFTVTAVAPGLVTVSATSENWPILTPRKLSLPPASTPLT